MHSKIERDLFAVVDELKHFRPGVYGKDLKITLQVPNKSLVESVIVCIATIFDQSFHEVKASAIGFLSILTHINNHINGNNF